jgi:hypothetical protein
MTIYQGAWCGVTEGDPCRVVCFPAGPDKPQPPATKFVFGAQEGYYSLGAPDNFASQFPESFACPTTCAGCAGYTPPSNGNGGPPPVENPTPPSEGEYIPPSVVEPEPEPGPEPGPTPLPPGPIPLPILEPPYSEPPTSSEREGSTFPFADPDPWTWPGAAAAYVGAVVGLSVEASGGTGATFLPDVVPPGEADPGNQRLGDTLLSPQG